MQGTPNLPTLLFLAGLLCSCVTTTEEPTPGPCEGLELGKVEVFASGFGGNEGISFSPDGRMFISAGEAIIEIFDDGTWSQVATVAGSIGLAWWNEHLMVAANDSGLGNGLDGVFKVDVDMGTTELLGTGIEGANFLTVTPWGTLLVAADSAPGIQEITSDGQVSVWAAGVPSPNGMAFNADQSVLWVATTFADPAPVWKLPITEGMAGTPVSVTEYSPGNVPDGVAMGLSDDVYVALNVAATIDRISAEGSVTTLATGIDWAASLAFGEGENFDPCSIYATSLFGDEVFRIIAAEPGLVPLR